MLVKSLPKLGYASQSTIEEVLSSTPKPEIPGPSHCSRFALVNIARYGSPLHVCMLNHFSHVRVCVTQRTVACQALLSTGFSGQEYWSGLPFCHPEDLVDLGIELTSLCLLHRQAGSLPLAPPRKPLVSYIFPKLEPKDWLRLLVLLFWSKSSLWLYPSLPSSPNDAYFYIFSITSVFFNEGSNGHPTLSLNTNISS